MLEKRKQLCGKHRYTYLNGMLRGFRITSKAASNIPGFINSSLYFLCTLVILLSISSASSSPSDSGHVIGTNSSTECPVSHKFCISVLHIFGYNLRQANMRRSDTSEVNSELSKTIGIRSLLIILNSPNRCKS